MRRELDLEGPVVRAKTAALRRRWVAARQINFPADVDEAPENQKVMTSDVGLYEKVER